MKSDPSVTLPLGRLKLALTGLGKVIPRKASLPILGCIRLSCDPLKNFVTLTATDLDIHLELDLPGGCGAKSGAFVVPLVELRDALKNGGGEDLVTLRADSNSSVTLIRERGETRISVPLPSLPLDEFPEGPAITKRPFELNPTDRDAFLEAMACVSADPTRQEIRGVKIEGGHTFVGTDGRHLYRSNSMKLPTRGDVILPYHRLLDWKPLHTDESWKLALQEEHFRFSGPDWRMTGKVIEGRYPNWKQVVPRENAFNSKILLSPAALEHMIAVLKTLPGDKTQDKPVGLHCTGTGFELLARGRHEDPFTRVPVPAEFTGQPLTVFVNRDYLGKALSFGLNRMEFSDAMSPVRLLEEGSPRRDFVVMPVRVIPSDPSLKPAEPPAPAVTPQPPTTPDTPSKNMDSKSHHTTPPAPREQNSEVAALDLASDSLQQMRELLRLMQTQMSELVTALKQARSEQRSTEREVRQVRSTIRTLQKVEL